MYEEENMERLLSVGEVAELLGLKVQIIYKYVCYRKITFIKLSGHALRFKLKDIEEWVAERSVKAGD